MTEGRQVLGPLHPATEIHNSVVPPESRMMIDTGDPSNNFNIEACNDSPEWVRVSVEETGNGIRFVITAEPKAPVVTDAAKWRALHALHEALKFAGADAALLDKTSGDDPGWMQIIDAVLNAAFAAPESRAATQEELRAAVGIVLDEQALGLAADAIGELHDPYSNTDVAEAAVGAYLTAPQQEPTPDRRGKPEVVDSGERRRWGDSAIWEED